jgi:hypothetical protein
MSEPTAIRPMIFVLTSLYKFRKELLVFSALTINMPPPIPRSFSPTTKKNKEWTSFWCDIQRGTMGLPPAIPHTLASLASPVQFAGQKINHIREKCGLPDKKSITHAR